MGACVNCSRGRTELLVPARMRTPVHFLVSDVDGTLVTRDKTLTQESVRTVSVSTRRGRVSFRACAELARRQASCRIIN